MIPRRFSAGSHAHFEVRRTPRSALHHAGSASLPWDRVQESLEQGTFPEALRGDFAFVWEGEDDTIAAVDHLATIPLFYTDTTIAPLFHELRASLADARVDPICVHQIRTFCGHSLGERTTVTQITRVQPGHYLRRGRQSCFIDLAAIDTDATVTPEALREVTEHALTSRLAEGRGNALLMSAGTDSVTLAGITRKHGLEARVDYLHLYSDRQWLSEASLALKVAQEMSLPLRMIRVRTSGHALPDATGRIDAFWLDDYFAGKVLGVRAAGHEASTIVTGEVGDQLFGGPKTDVLLYHVLARGRVDARELASLWLNVSNSFGRVSGTEKTPWMVERIAQDPTFAEVYEDLLDQLAAILRGARTHDFLNRLLILNLIVKGPFRVYPSSQDPMRWVHPFAAWSVVEHALKLPSRMKIGEGGTLKAIYRTLWGEWVSAIPWRSAKSGMRLPLRHRLSSPIDP